VERPSKRWRLTKVFRDQRVSLFYHFKRIVRLESVSCLTLRRVSVDNLVLAETADASCANSTQGSSATPPPTCASVASIVNNGGLRASGRYESHEASSARTTNTRIPVTLAPLSNSMFNVLSKCNIIITPIYIPYETCQRSSVGADYFFQYQLQYKNGI